MTALFWILAVLACADTFQVVAAGRCRDGWTYYPVTNFCYAFFDKATGFFVAGAYCEEAGATLATPHTIEELQFVYSLRSVTIWMGLDDFSQDGKFVWQDGQPLQYDNWQDGRPVSHMYDNCVTASPEFYDGSCYLVVPFVCQAPSTPDPCDGFTCENGGACNSTTGVAVCHCLTIYTGERCEQFKTVSYEVIVFTSDVYAADTDANVYIRITGESGTSFEKLLDNESVDDFEQGQTDTFAFAAADVGKINTVVIWHDNYGSYAGWHLGYVTVRKYEYESSAYVDYTFSCDCWLDVDGTLSRTLENPKVSPSA